MKRSAKTLRHIQRMAALVAMLGLGGCSTTAVEYLNPFRDPGPPDEYVGDPTNRAILEESGIGSGGNAGSNSSDNARAALEVMGSYRRQQPPQPTYPVVQPAEVRLMWVPDHLNKTGDLVPAHYYFLKVLDDRWAVQDAFDLETQLNASTPGGSSASGGATPWVYGEPEKRR